MKYDIVEQLKKEIADFSRNTEIRDIGVVKESSDGTIRISGLEGAFSQELLQIETARGTVIALASNLEEGAIGAIVLGADDAVRVGDRVTKTNQVLSIPVNDELIGRVIDPLGLVLDGKAPLSDSSKKTRYPLERPAPSVVMRESVRTPLHTGVMAIDAMVPIGRGQRELIIGDRQTGKTAIAIDAILNQQNDSGRSPVTCIYVAVGQKQSKVATIVRLLEEAGAMKYTVVVSAPASAPAALQYLAPFAGCAIGEYFMDQGKDVLVVYDDLSKHAVAYRQLSLLLRRPPGREAYPGDVFYLHARLLERAAKLSKELGGGSLTALPIIETQLGDVSAYVPTNVISITDGQIYLESNLFYQGVRPAINAGLSVSRVGSAAQTKAMKKVAGKLRLELAQFRELKAFAQFSSDLDEATRKKIDRGERLVEVLKQRDGAPVSFELQAIMLFAVLNGFFDSIPVAVLHERMRLLMRSLHELYPKDILEAIKSSGDIDDDMKVRLSGAIQHILDQE